MRFLVFALALLFCVPAYADCSLPPLKEGGEPRAGMYVQRDGGVITGVYAKRQPGYAEECVAKDAAEMVEFDDKTDPSNVAQTMSREEALIEVLKEKKLITERDVLDKLDASRRSLRR